MGAWCCCSKELFENEIACCVNGHTRLIDSILSLSSNPYLPCRFSTLSVSPTELHDVHHLGTSQKNPLGSRPTVLTRQNALNRKYQIILCPKEWRNASKDYKAFNTQQSKILLINRTLLSVLRVRDLAILFFLFS